ncbi:hypothetical protein H4S06_000148 [Coemansia sp. BCRC 34490]|nr:hypothetical protein H4S06_000148 [Coemansia sp. BCRC 34490]
MASTGSKPSLFPFDSHDRPIEGGVLKPDIAFATSVSWPAWSDILIVVEIKSPKRGFSTSLKQLNEYFINMWTSAPRKYTIGLVIAKDELHLVVNTRAGAHRSTVSRLPFFSNERVLYSDQAEDMRLAEKRCFATVLRVLDCLFSSLLKEGCYLAPGPLDGQVHMGIQNGKDLISAQRKIVSWDQADYDFALTIFETLDSRCPYAVGSMSWIYSVRYVCKREPHDNRKGVMKIHSFVKSRLSEAKIYEVLHEQGVPNIPLIYFSGSLGEHDGYESEVILMEYMDMSLRNHIQGMFSEGSGSHSKLIDVVAGYSATLLAAASADSPVLHRDISSGNLMVRRGNPVIIDWGFGLVLSFNERVEEVHHPPKTGTLIYMGLRVLQNASRRSVIDDFESLLFTIFHLVCLVCDPKQAKADAIWDDQLEMSQFLEVRKNWLKDEISFIRKLPSNCPKAWEELLVMLYDLLFDRHGIQMGLEHDETDPRLLTIDFDSCGSRGSQVSSTPAKLQTREGIAPAEAEEIRKRRDRLERQFMDGYTEKIYNDFLYDIGELATFKDFVKLANKTLFEDIAQAAPVLDNKTLRSTKGMERSKLFKALVSGGKSGEAALMNYFLELCSVMAEKAASLAELKIPQERHALADHQRKPVFGSAHKADGVFFYSGPTGGNITTVHMFVEAKLAPTYGYLPTDTLRQILDYVNTIWTVQYTRFFVPIMYLHGEQLTLFVFTRGPWYRVELGNICYTSSSPKYQIRYSLRETLLRLWFITTLPAERFGHFCDAETGLQSIRFEKTSATSKLTCATLVDPGDQNTLSLAVRIPRTVNPRSRLTCLFDTTYQFKRAVLKLSWTPVKRLPEGAVYEVLRRSGIKGIPMVYDSGLIKEDFYGYRLEYIILEHCGESIGSYVRNSRDSNIAESEINRQVVQFIGQLSSCLVQARIHGVIHRDISDGNIAVNNEQARIIDWGYAKIIEAGSADNLGADLSIVSEVAKQWGFEKDTVLKYEDASDHMTGTVLFMSIPVLFGARKRSLADDIESLFYVIIRAFSTSDNCCGFRYYDYKNLALTRVGILGCTDNYLKHFSAGSNVGGLRKTLDAMHRYLFYSGDRYIGHDLVNNENYERLPDLAMAAKFMDKKSVSALQKLFPTNNNEAGVGSKRRRREGTGSP